MTYKTNYNHELGLPSGVIKCFWKMADLVTDDVPSEKKPPRPSQPSLKLQEGFSNSEDLERISTEFLYSGRKQTEHCTEGNTSCFTETQL